MRKPRRSRFFRPLLLACAGSALLGAAAFARADGWERNHGPSGYASAHGIAVGTAAACAGRQAFFAAADSGVWRRCGVDGRWQSLGAVIWASGVAVDPLDDRNLFVSGSSLALGTSLLRSRDGGATWTPPEVGLPFAWTNAVKVLPTHPATALVAGVGGMYRSVDGGARWQPVAGIDPSAYMASLAFDAAMPNLAFASGSGGIYRSIDAGATWSRLQGGLPDGAFGDSVSVRVSRRGTTVYAAVDGAAWRSLDGGDHWSRADGFGLPPHAMTAVAADSGPRAPAVVYGLLWDWTTGLPALWRSADAGGTWSPAGPPLAPNDVLQAVVTDPRLPGAVYTTSQISGVQASRDGGDSWSTGNEGLIGTSGRVAVAPSAPQVVYAGSYKSGPFRSRDGGRSWTRINEGLYFDGLGVQAIAVSPTNADTVLIGTGWGELTSTDAGDHWTWTSTGLPSDTLTTVQALAVTASRPGTWYAGTVGAGIYKRVDNGDWMPVGAANHNVYAIAIDPARPDTVYASIYDGFEGPPNTRVGLGIVKTTDGGATWMPVDTGLGNLVVRTLAVDPANAGTVYAGTQGAGIYKSVDGAQTWRPSGTGAGRQPSAIVIDPRDAASLYAATYDAGVFRSVDGGAHWTPLNRGLDVPTTSAQGLAIDPVGGRRLYLATLMSGVAVRSTGPDE